MCEASLLLKEEMLAKIERFGKSRGDVEAAPALTARIADSGRSTLLLERVVESAARSTEPLGEVLNRVLMTLVSDNDPAVVSRKLIEAHDELSRRRFELVRLLPTRS